MLPRFVSRWTNAVLDAIHTELDYNVSPLGVEFFFVYKHGVMTSTARLSRSEKCLTLSLYLSLSLLKPVSPIILDAVFMQIVS